MTGTAQKFVTIRQAASTGVLPEYTLRLMEKQGRLLGIRSGNRFLVNIHLLIEQLERESLAQIRSEASGQVQNG